jgi:hypothetical protein
VVREEFVLDPIPGPFEPPVAENSPSKKVRLSQISPIPGPIPALKSPPKAETLPSPPTLRVTLEEPEHSIAG